MQCVKLAAPFFFFFLAGAQFSAPKPTGEQLVVAPPSSPGLLEGPHRVGYGTIQRIS